MIDRTNIGISQLNSNQTDTSFVAPPTVEVNPIVPGAITTIPAQTEAYTAPIIDQGYTLPQTTTTILPETTTSFNPTITQTFLPDTNFSTTVSPQITFPSQTFTSYMPQVTTTTSFLPTTDIQTMPTDYSFQTSPTMYNTGIPGLSIIPEEGIPTMSIVPDNSVQSIITPTPVVSAQPPLNVTSNINNPETVLPPPPPKILISNPLAQTTISNNGLTVPPPVPKNGPMPPVLDEDFHRGRPTYVINQDRYKECSLYQSTIMTYMK